MSLRARLTGTLRALRWAGWQLTKAAVVVAIAAAVLHYGTGVGVSGGGDASVASSTGSSGTGTASHIDVRRAEKLVLQNVNNRREQRGMDSLSYSERAAAKARSHARDMAANDYYSHTSQDGVTQTERYSFCRGGENIHKGRISQSEMVYQSSRTVDTTDAAGVARYLVLSWMNSRPHRERGLFGPWRSAGVGIAVSDTGEVYGVMGFCSE